MTKITTKLFTTGRPHRRGEAAARVEDRTCERTDPVEEDLRDEEPREGHHEGAFLAMHRRCVDRHEHRRAQRRHQRDHRERDRHEGEHPLVVRAAAVRVPLGRVDEQWHEHAGEDAAEEQVEDRVRERVRVVVGIGDHAGAERVCDHRGPDEPGHPGGERAGRHHPAGADQALGSAWRRARSAGWLLLRLLPVRYRAGRGPPGGPSAGP